MELVDIFDFAEERVSVFYVLTLQRVFPTKFERLPILSSRVNNTCYLLEINTLLC